MITTEIKTKLKTIKLCIIIEADRQTYIKSYLRMKDNRYTSLEKKEALKDIAITFYNISETEAEDPKNLPSRDKLMYDTFHNTVTLTALHNLYLNVRGRDDCYHNVPQEYLCYYRAKYNKLVEELELEDLINRT